MIRRFTVHRLLNAFGSLLDVTAKEKTDARRVLDALHNVIATRNDGEAISSYFHAVGRDLSVAMRKYENEQTERKTNRAHLHINNRHTLSPHGGKKSRRGTWVCSKPPLR